MHILLLPSTYPTVANPVRGIFYRDQALALRRAGHTVGVLTVTQIWSKHTLKKIHKLFDFRAGFDVSDDGGVITYRIEYWNLFSNANRTAYVQAISRAIKLAYDDYIKKNGTPDVIHSHNCLFGGYAGVGLKEKTGLPLVLTEHASNFITRTIPASDIPLVNLTLQVADVRLAVSESLKQALAWINPALPFSVLGNIVDTEFFTPTSTHSASRPFVFCAVCSLVPIKALDYMVRAFASVAAYENVILRIAGQGDQQQMLLKLVDDLGIRSRVEFMGQLSREGVRELLRTSHALVSSSRVETFGVNLIEALSCGMPVIATRSGGPEGFINESNGILVPVDDVEALAVAMKQMVITYNRYNSAVIRQNCIDLFSEQVIVEKLEKLYCGLKRKS